MPHTNEEVQAAFSGTMCTWERKSSDPVSDVRVRCGRCVWQSKLKFHSDFEDDINAQLSSIEKLKTDADDLLERHQFDQSASELVETKRKAAAASWDLLQASAGAKKENLQNALDFLNFTREHDEVRAGCAAACWSQAAVCVHTPSLCSSHSVVTCA